MSDVKRYTLWWESEGGAELEPYQETDADGKWLLASDYDALRAQRDQLRQHKNDYMDAAEGTRKALLAEIEALKAERDALRKDAERFRWINTPTNFQAAVSRQLWRLHGSPEFGKRIDKAIGKGKQP